LQNNLTNGNVPFSIMLLTGRPPSQNLPGRSPDKRLAKWKV